MVDILAKTIKDAHDKAMRTYAKFNIETMHNLEFKEWATTLIKEVYSYHIAKTGNNPSDKT